METGDVRVVVDAKDAPQQSHISTTDFSEPHLRNGR
jgi:hypothetical protein